MATTSHPDRIYYLDAMRVFLISLVVISHAAQVYNPQQSWLVFNDTGSTLAYYAVTLTSQLRMPAFFIVAGFFTVLSFHKQNFLSRRLSRLFIPLVTVAVTLNSLQAYLLTQTGWKEYGILEYLSKGDWIQHLWFLINLITYTIFSFLLAVKVNEKTKTVLHTLIRAMKKVPISVVLAFLPSVSIFILIVDKFIPGYILGINLDQILWYMPFFFFGALISADRELLRRFTHISPFITIPITIVAFMLNAHFASQLNLFEKVMYTYSGVLGTWFASALLFYIFKKVADRPSTFFSKLSEASYSVYLVHHLVVVMIALVLIRVSLPPTAGVLLLTLLVGCISYGIHAMVISKSKLLTYLMNGTKGFKK